MRLVKGAVILTAALMLNGGPALADHDEVEAYAEPELADAGGVQAFADPVYDGVQAFTDPVPVTPSPDDPVPFSEPVIVTAPDGTVTVNQPQPDGTVVGSVTLPDGQTFTFPESVPVTPEVIHEDDPRWDCRTMGNRTCGVTIHGETYLVTFDVNGEPVAVTG